MSTVPSGFRAFAYVHDDLPVFHAVFLVLTFLAAIMFNLGTFGLLVAIHMCLDVVKYREHFGFTWIQTIEGVIRESLVDVALLMVGLVFAVYLHHSVGIASLSGLLRAEVSIVRTLAMLVPKLKILHHFLKIVAHIHHYMETTHPRFQKGWSDLDKLCFAFVGISTLLIVLAADLMNVERSLIQAILLEEMIPWNL